MLLQRLVEVCAEALGPPNAGASLIVVSEPLQATRAEAALNTMWRMPEEQPEAIFARIVAPPDRG